MTGTHAAIVEDVPGVPATEITLTRFGKIRHSCLSIPAAFTLTLRGHLCSGQRAGFFAIEEGDIIIHLLDGRDGLTPADMELARLLRASGKKVLWAVNKIDAPSRENRVYEFYHIGTEDIFPVSAATGYGYEEFMEKLGELLPDYHERRWRIP